MTSARSKSDLVELKRQALEYYASNSEIPKRIEEALNLLFFESPYDAFGYLSEFFQNHSKPAFISRVCASKHTILDARSQPTFQVELYCHNRNKEIKLISLECPCFTFDQITDAVKIQLVQEEDNYRTAKLDEIRHLINSEVNHLVKNHSPYDQDEIDEKINKLFRTKQAMVLESTSSMSSRKTSAATAQPAAVEASAANAEKPSRTPTSPKQKGTKTGNAAAGAAAATNQARKASKGVHAAILEDEFYSVLHSHYYPSFVQAFLSKLVCLSSWHLSKKSLFEHIGDLYSRKPEKYSMPIPLVTVLQNGKGFNGKQNLIKEFILLPKPHLSVQKGIEIINKVNRYIRDTLYQGKQQPGAVNKCITDIGCFTCALDTPQQGLEMIETAIQAVCGPTSDDLSLALNLAAGEIFDQDKNKYEVVNGGFKSSDELIEIYADLIAKNPRIMMLIEPFTSSDQVAWYKLYLKISNYCLIANNIRVNDNFEKNEHLETRTGLEGDHVDNNENGLEAETNTARQNRLMELLDPRSIEMPVSFYKFENMTTLSGVLRKLDNTHERNLYAGLGCGLNETNDTFISDLCVASQVKFMRVGGLNRSERTSKLNRLIEIEHYLEEHNTIVDLKDPSREIKFTAGLEIPPEVLTIMKTHEENATTKKNVKQTKTAE